MNPEITDANTDTSAAVAAGLLLGDFKKNPDEQSPIAAVVLVPQGAEAQKVDRPALPFRRKGIVKLNDTASFIDYFKRYTNPATTNIYGSLEPLNFTALFNDTPLNEDNKNPPYANWRDFGCSYTPKHSKEFSIWREKNKQRFDSNEDFATWLEDNLPDVIEPSNGSLLELALNFKVNSNASFSNAVRLPDGNSQLNFSNTVEGSSQVGNGQVKIPELIKIQIPVFEGRNVPVYNFEARFRYRLTGSKLSIWYELIRPHKVVELAFSDMVAAIEKDTEQTILYGTP